MDSTPQEYGTARLRTGAGADSVAFTTAGTGPPLLVVPGWLTHLELSWAVARRAAVLRGAGAGPHPHPVRPTRLRPVRRLRGAADDGIGASETGADLSAIWLAYLMGLIHTWLRGAFQITWSSVAYHSHADFRTGGFEPFIPCPEA